MLSSWVLYIKLQKKKLCYSNWHLLLMSHQEHILSASSISNSLGHNHKSTCSEVPLVPPAWSPECLGGFLHWITELLLHWIIVLLKIVLMNEWSTTSVMSYKKCWSLLYQCHMGSYDGTRYSMPEFQMPFLCYHTRKFKRLRIRHHCDIPSSDNSMWY